MFRPETVGYQCIGIPRAMCPPCSPRRNHSGGSGAGGAAPGVSQAAQSTASHSEVPPTSPRPRVKSQVSQPVSPPADVACIWYRGVVGVPSRWTLFRQLALLAAGAPAFCHGPFPDCVAREGTNPVLVRVVVPEAPK